MMILQRWENPQWVNRYSMNALRQYKDNVIDAEEAATNSGANSSQETIQDYSTRKKLWTSLFGTLQMPEQEDDAVSKYAGSFRKDYPNINDDDIEDAIKDAKDK